MRRRLNEVPSVDCIAHSLVSNALVQKQLVESRNKKNCLFRKVNLGRTDIVMDGKKRQKFDTEARRSSFCI